MRRQWEKVEVMKRKAGKKTWLGTGNVRRDFPVSSVHDCVQSVRKNIREDIRVVPLT